MLLAWTTVATPEDATRLARGAVEAGLAACVQVEGPIVSHYRWEGRLETVPEYRLLFKFMPEQAGALAKWLQARHPYDTPEWVVVRAEQVSEKYLSWARGTSTPPLFPQPPSPS
jgi:periplasmic divalent cation tolerance protein